MQLGKSITDVKKEQDKKAKAKETKAKEVEAKAKSEHELEDCVKDIMTYFQDNLDDRDKIKPIVAEIKKLGYDKPQSISKVEDAKAILKLCK